MHPFQSNTVSLIYEGIKYLCLGYGKIKTYRCQLKKKVLAYSLVGGVFNPDLSGNALKNRG